MESIQTRVVEGIKYLNTTFPDWWEEIDDEAIDNGSSNGHILTLITGIDWNISPFRAMAEQDYNWAYEKGFSTGLYEYGELNIEWAEQIRILQGIQEVG